MPNVPHNQGLCPAGCFGCKVASVGFSATAMPTRKGSVTNRGQMESKMEKDVAAYRRLRANGLQPKATKDASIIERTADSKWEVETGQRVPTAKIGAQLDKIQAGVVAGEFA